MTETWGTGSRGRDLGRLGREAETLEGLVETAETTEIWSMADPCHDDLTNGQSLLQLTLKPRSVKLIYH